MPSVNLCWMLLLCQGPCQILRAEKQQPQPCSQVDEIPGEKGSKLNLIKSANYSYAYTPLISVQIGLVWTLTLKTSLLVLTEPWIHLSGLKGQAEPWGQPMLGWRGSFPFYFCLSLTVGLWIRYPTPVILNCLICSLPTQWRRVRPVHANMWVRSWGPR